MNPAACTLDVIVAIQARGNGEGTSMTSAITATGLRKSFGGKVVLERDPVIIELANSWIILNVGGGPTDDKPEVTLTTPPDPNRTSAFLNIRVADITKVYREWSAGRPAG